MKAQTLLYIILLFPIHLYSHSLSLEKISFYGNKRTRTHVILRELKIKPGKPLNNEIILKDQLWLLRLNFLRRIEFFTKPGSAYNKRNMMVVIQEKDKWSTSPTISNNNLFGWTIGIDISLNNFRGTRERINTKIQLGKIRKINLSWNKPWFGGKFRLFTKLNLYHIAYPYLYEDYPSHFEEENTGILMTLGKSFGRTFKTGFRICLENIWTNDVKVALSGKHNDRIWNIESFVLYDTRDLLFYPQKGIYFQSWIRTFEIQKKKSFFRTGMDFRLYFPVYSDNILAIQTALQFSNGEVPIYKRLHLGGSKTIRGYRTGFLIGENSYLTSIEYRFPILYERNPVAGINVGYAGVLFTDFGTAWFQDESFKLNKIRGAVGLGIHVIWDHWVLRAEYGTHGKGWGFINTGTSIKF
jgi:outer membrane protein insertion porin family